MRIVLFTGKGGVGKTSVAAATALQCADAGRRTIIFSTDPAHSLADAFGQPLGSDPTCLADHLWGQQLDATERLEEVWGDVQAYLVALLDWAGVDAIEAEELSLLPGLDEIFSLAELKAHADDGAWDVIIVDCAPTAETIRLLALPDALSWYMDRVFPVGHNLTRVARPFLSRLTSIPIASDEVFAACRRLYDRFDGIRALLTDRRTTTARLVVNPEKMVIAEARRTATYLSLFGYRLDAVIVNRLLPDTVSDPWFKAWKEAHAEHLATIEEGFAPIPVLRAELCSEELVGTDRLRSFAAGLYADVPPETIFHEAEPLRLERRDHGHVLSVSLPFAERDDLEVGRRDGELIVRVGPHRRALMLPDSLRHRPVTGAALAGERLEVSFGPQWSRGEPVVAGG